MTQAATAGTPATVITDPEDIAAAIAERSVVKKQWANEQARHEAAATGFQTKHTAIQAEIDGAMAALKAGQPWTVPVNTVMNQAPQPQQRAIPPRGPVRPPQPPAASAPVPAPEPPTSPAGSIAASVAATA